MIYNQLVLLHNHFLFDFYLFDFLQQQTPGAAYMTHD